MINRIRGAQGIRLTILVVMAVILRGIAITSRSVWYDEAFAVLFSEKGLTAMLYGTLASNGRGVADVHPLAYYSLLSVWMRIFGEGLASIRGLSIVFGTGTVVLVYFLARSLLGEKAAFCSACLIALSPFHIHYSQEVRMYSMLAFLLILATWALWEGMRSGKMIWWGIFAIVAALAQYTHNLAVFYLAPLALTPLLARQWKALRMLFLSVSIAIILYLPWFIHVPGQFAKVQQGYWTTKPSLSRVITTLLSFITNLPLPPSWVPLALFVTLLPITVGIWQTYRSYRLGISNVWRGAWFFYLGITPAILLFVFSQWQPIYIERGLLASGVCFLVWIGWAMTNAHLPRLARPFSIGLLLLGFGMGFYQHVTYAGFPYAPYEQIDRTLKDRFKAGDVILHSNKLTMLPAVYYDRTLVQRYIGDPKGSGADTLALPTQTVLGLYAADSVAEGVDDAQRVWLIIFAKAIDEYKALGYETHPHITWLRERYPIERVETWGDVLIYVFSR